MTSRLIRFVPVLLPMSVLACDEPQATTSQPDNGTPLAADESAVAISVVGAGTVTYDVGATPPCIGDGSANKKCPYVVFKGGAGSVTATPAAGWRFKAWSLELGEQSENAITNPSLPTQKIAGGTTVSLVATFESLVKPIKATFTQAAFSTTYELAIENPDLDVVKVKWSGPQCGEWGPQDEAFGAESTTRFAMTWRHPHPPCPDGKEHTDTTIKATITIKDKKVVCEYVGAETGEGKVCRPE